MLITSLAILIRIFSNSLINVFQKSLTQKGQRSSIINFYTYLGLTIFCIPLLITSNIDFNNTLICNFLIMGLLGALGNYFIIKALSIGELSTLAPINSYKPVIALIIGFYYLHEIPSINSLFAILLIILGSVFIFDINNKDFSKKSIFYRFLALTFSATEAIFIKKIIDLTDISTAFYLWCIAGLIFTSIFSLKSQIKDYRLKSYKTQILLILSVGLMQYSTNFVFNRINVGYALATFQLSSIISVIFGANLFNEKNIAKKLFATTLMLIGAIILILKN